MENLKILEYDPSYARSLAEMWQKSKEGWNGGHGNETEESIIAEHAATTNINTYLAVLNDEVLGYCGFSRYLEDEGALYIKLLNTRFDYHGKGIGKALVKKSVERTVELGWPRLDLYTWSANTKSIPLYKKCGFFLENRQDATHLMNFIPTVLQTEAVKEYFNEADWYGDLKRTIDIEPDGKSENGFDFYEYIWERNEKRLRMEFERRGRGLRLIETDDYLISLSVSSHNLVFGKSYRAMYEIINKTKEPLKIEISGRDDKNIRFQFSKSLVVTDRETVEGEFFVSEIEEEFNNFKTHPGVVSELLINGKRAVFKLGITPKFPAKVSLSCVDIERHCGETLDVYIDIESGLNEKGTFEFELPGDSNIEFSKYKFSIEMDKGEKASIPVRCRLLKPSLYSAKLNIAAILSSGERILFNKRVAAAFRGRGYAFGGELEDKYIITNGAFRVILDKNENIAEVRNYEADSHTIFLCPKLGRPYSEEFCSSNIQNVKWYCEKGSILLTGEYVSKDFKNTVLKPVFELSGNGMLKYYYEIINTSMGEDTDELWINQSFVYNTSSGFAGAVIPYGNKVISVTEPGMQWHKYIDSSRISENWIFSNSEGQPKGIVWPKDLQIGFEAWFAYLEHDVGRLEPGERRATKPVCLAMSTFKNWRELRKFAAGTNDVKEKYCAMDFEIAVNEGNPFVNDKFDITVTENRKYPLKGQITVASVNEAFDEINVEIGDNVDKVVIHVDKTSEVKNDIISIKNDLATIRFERKVPVFYVEDIDVRPQVVEEEGMKVYSLNNGVMNIKACPEFSAGIYSLEFDSRDWLETSFPEAGPRTWFNPWFGGIQTLPGIFINNGRSLLKEKIEAEFIEKADSLGNRWKGIRSSMVIQHNEEFKGLKLNQYFLMLPGVPVLCHTAELVQDMGKFINRSEFFNYAFLKIDEEASNNWASVKNKHGDITKYIAGGEDFDIFPDSSMLYGSDNVEYRIQVFSDFDYWKPYGFLNTKDFGCNNVKNLSLAAGQRMFLPPVFYIFTREHISDKLLGSLKNLRFE